jgi:hypothetical protein
MAHLRLNEDDQAFLNLPNGAALVFAGASGTQTWIERERDTVVRLAVKSVGVALANAASLEVVIEIGPDSARGKDGPAPSDALLRASQAVQVLVRGGERLSFRAYPVADDAHVLRTIVWTEDVKSELPANSARHTHDARGSEHRPSEARSVEPRSDTPSH